ncbi:nucleic acid-binding protein [Thermococcus sp. 4557]|uniref:PIN domain-containing protein n=1 Tax=Thermococcus sp. (strain CGMCC 1.5172 / 4557) TaxID=1042877 RepID=UPI000219ED57|nr:PIN domain-containing protein [Thermococcus sp. 4557]AEK72333.1 nucleic acid-binding protein [Thermococcus sp. 4557]
MIFIDSSVLYNALVVTELTGYAAQAFKLEEPRITSETVIDEVWFALLKRDAGSPWKIRKELKNSSEFRKMAVKYLSGILGFLSAQNVVIVPDSSNWTKVAYHVKEFGLMPHDARILATALEYNCDKLATLDKDFGPVRGVIKLVPVEFWQENR